MSADTNTDLRYIRQGHTCYYCKGHTHFIDPDSYPNDVYAKEVEPNKWMCGNCIDAAEENTVLRTADPTSPRYQQVLAKRQAELDKKMKLHEQLENVKELNRIAESNKLKYKRLTG
jgi:hypothetical protein